MAPLSLMFEIAPRDRGASRTFTQIGQSAERSRKGIDKFRVAAVTGGAIAAAAAVKFGKDSIRAYTESQQSQMRRGQSARL